MSQPLGNPLPRDPPVDGIVLAAGRSSRMGAPKAALDLEGQTFLARCIALLREGGCRSVVVVLPDQHAAATIAGPGPGAADDVVITINPDPGSQPIDSLRIGLAALPADAAAAAVLPVDSPAAQPETVRRLLRAFREAEPGRALVVRPVHGGEPGHPTLFARPLFRELATDALPHGAETVVERHAGARLDVPVDDPGVARNVNTPDDYRSLLEGP